MGTGRRERGRSELPAQPGPCRFHVPELPADGPHLHHPDLSGRVRRAHAHRRRRPRHAGRCPAGDPVLGGPGPGARDPHGAGRRGRRHTRRGPRGDGRELAALRPGGGAAPRLRRHPWHALRTHAAAAPRGHDRPDRPARGTPGAGHRPRARHPRRGPHPARGRSAPAPRRAAVRTARNRQDPHDQASHVPPGRDRGRAAHPGQRADAGRDGTGPLRAAGTAGGRGHRPAAGRGSPRLRNACPAGGAGRPGRGRGHRGGAEHERPRRAAAVPEPSARPHRPAGRGAPAGRRGPREAVRPLRCTAGPAVGGPAGRRGSHRWCQRCMDPRGGAPRGARCGSGSPGPVR